MVRKSCRVRCRVVCVITADVAAIEAPKLRWPDSFPIKSALPLRVVIIEPTTIDCLCTSASPGGLLTR